MGGDDFQKKSHAKPGKNLAQRAIQIQIGEMAAARRSAATALIRGELKGVYLLTTPTIRNAKAIVRSTTRQR